MFFLSALLVLLAWGVDAVVGGRQPFQLTGKAIVLYRLASAAVNLWTMTALWRSGPALGRIIGWIILSNALFLMTVTDLKEKMVYSIHFYVLLAGGAAGAFLSLGGAAIGRYFIFLILFGIFYLFSRKKPGLGLGDSRVIACLTLYFSFSRWMEVMILALGSALIYGLVGLFRKKKTMKTEVPFMPFLLFGTLVEFML